MNTFDDDICNQRIDMDAMKVLPYDILRKQVCQECNNYLSAPPIVINDQGETICGRCVSLIEHGQKTKSLFNSLANGFHFKCINHFNGCTKILAFQEVKFHEEECLYEPQDCIFCSFSGNLSQIFNHAVKIHPESISFDGIIPLSLSNYPLKKKFYLSVRDNHLFVVTIELTERLFRILLKPTADELPLNINQYVVKFYKHDDQESSSDYGLFSINPKNTIEKSREDLVKILGLTNINCQILMDTFTSEKREMELQRIFFDLRRSKEQVTNLAHKLLLDRAELVQQRENYDLAKEVIKRMSFFECSNCRNVIFGETFFCPKNHCYCRKCLSSVCGVCKVTREFSKLSSMEEFSVSCDWPDCGLNILIKDFQSHRRDCQFRPYKCPLQDCNKIILSIQELREHWHANSPTLTVDNEVTCNSYKCQEYYLIFKNDIYHLMINFDENGIQAYVEEYNVLQNDVRVRCRGLFERSWYTLEMSEVCGRYQIDTKNKFSDDKKYRAINISLR